MNPFAERLIALADEYEASEGRSIAAYDLIIQAAIKVEAWDFAYSMERARLENGRTVVQDDR